MSGTEYVVMPSASVVHRSTCSHVTGRRSVAVPVAPEDVDPAGYICSRCMPWGWATERAKQLLDPWGDRYVELMISLDSYVRGATNEELDELERATRWPSTTNCGWGTYAMVPSIKEAVRREQHARQKLAGQPTDGGPR